MPFNKVDLQGALTKKITFTVDNTFKIKTMLIKSYLQQYSYLHINLIAVMISNGGSGGQLANVKNDFSSGGRNPRKSFALILSFKGYVDITLTTLNGQVLFCLFCNLVCCFSTLIVMNFALIHNY